mgnify:CR=1 FL=1
MNLNYNLYRTEITIQIKKRDNETFLQIYRKTYKQI